jgi:predicted MPP superfamily phosphohydrolase
MLSKSVIQRIFIALFVASAASAVLIGMHYYIAKRLVLDPGIASPWRGVLLAAVAALGLCLVVQPFAERLVRPPVSRVISWPASLWMGFAFLLVILLAFSDAVLWLTGGAALAASGGASGGEPAAAVRAALVAAGALLAGAFGLRSAMRPPALQRVEIALERWPESLDGFRIVQISDLHIGPILGRAFAEQLVARVDALEPDLVALTGDLVDGSVRQLANEVAPLAGLRARHGVYFVTGNHDHYSGARRWCEKVRELGIHVLRNQRVEIRDGATVFDLVGVDDHHGSHFGGGQGGGEDLGAALDGRDRSRPAVLLAHDPSTFKRASTMAIDLQISGHTHGGQIWPFGLLVHLAVPFVAGRFRRNGAELYVSRGTGFWGPPMRLFAPAEVTEIVLRRRATGSSR